MFGKTCWLKPGTQVFEPCKVLGVKPPFSTDTQADTMHGYRETLGQMTQLRQGAAAVAHVILGMDFKPLNGVGILRDVFEMLGFIANTGGRREV
jgi:hypothetical protein